MFGLRIKMIEAQYGAESMVAGITESIAAGVHSSRSSYALDQEIDSLVRKRAKAHPLRLTPMTSLHQLCLPP